MLLRTLDTVALRGEGPILLLGRLAIAALFLPSGFSKLTHLDAFAQMLARQGLPGPAMVWAIAGAAIEFLASLALLVGLKTRLAALLLAAFTIVAAFLAHRYWPLSDPALYRQQSVNFWKNVAIAGGLLFVFVRGAGPISIDRR